ncbi:MAG: RHS repeat-associated core domain-containing protein, partial [Acidobacteria bacterium]|nr:RHS repeat-associated core domain-containing protein [Acidobacteriota bacterium]
SSGSTTNVFRWVGQLGYYYDADRLAYYLRARPYSPKLARFLSKDPIGFAGSEWNHYEYVGDSPITWTDPSGLVWDPRKDSWLSSGLCLFHVTAGATTLTACSLALLGGPKAAFCTCCLTTGPLIFILSWCLQHPRNAKEQAFLNVLFGAAAACSVRAIANIPWKMILAGP